MPQHMSASSPFGTNCSRITTSLLYYCTVLCLHSYCEVVVYVCRVWKHDLLPPQPLFRQVPQPTPPPQLPHPHPHRTDTTPNYNSLPQTRLCLCKVLILIPIGTVVSLRLEIRTSIKIHMHLLYYICEYVHGMECTAYARVW